MKIDIQAGYRPARRVPQGRGSAWVRAVLSLALVLGLGPLLPVGAAGAVPVQHGDHAKSWGSGEGRGHGGHEARSVVGVVTEVLSSNEFIVKTASGKTLDVEVSASTTYGRPQARGGTATSFGNVSVGERVQLRGTEPSPGTFDASSVEVPRALVAGKVEAVSSEGFTLSPARSALTSTAATVQVDISTRTVFKDPGVSSPSISDVRVGDFVRVLGAQAGLVSGVLTVDADVVVLPLVRYIGTVGALGPSGFTLTSTSSTVTATVEVTATTRYQVPGVKSASLANLVKGDLAMATGDQEGTGTMSALFVRVLGLGHHFGRGHGRGGFSLGSGAGPFGKAGDGGSRGDSGHKRGVTHKTGDAQKTTGHEGERAGRR